MWREISQGGGALSPNVNITVHTVDIVHDAVLVPSLELMRPMWMTLRPRHGMECHGMGWDPPLPPRQLEDAVKDLADDESVRAVVLTSAVPGVFCAGADLKERATMSSDETEQFVTRLRTLMDKVADIPVPTIAAVEGGWGWE